MVTFLEKVYFFIDFFSTCYRIGRIRCFLVDVNNSFAGVNTSYIPVFIQYYIKKLKSVLNRTTKTLKNDRTQNVGNPM
jgi:hypothetical protein